MLKLHENKDSINVVFDQIGAPTSAKYLAKVCWEIINFGDIKKLPQILHWSDSGVASWYDIAVAVGDIGLELGLIKKKAHVFPIKTINYPTPAKRPKYSVLDCSQTYKELNLKPINWITSIEDIIKKIK